MKFKIAISRNNLHLLGIGLFIVAIILVNNFLSAGSFDIDSSLSPHQPQHGVESPSPTIISQPTKTPTTPKPSPAPSVPSFEGKEFGTWIWVAPDRLSTSQMASSINSAASNGFNVIYITIDNYLEIEVLPDGIKKSQKKMAYMSAVSRFIGLAASKGITVYAEAGWRDWAEPDMVAKSNAIIDFVKEYNALNVKQKFGGLQFDVEPYLMPSFEEDKGSILGNFVAWADGAVTRTGNSGFELSFVIPHFYDSTQKWTPIVEYQGYSTYVFSHLLNSLSRLERSSLVIMAYRNFASGQDGSIKISEREVREASSGYLTRIIVAQEVGDVQPDYVTFYGTSRDKLFGEVEKIVSAFSEYAQFSGIAIHYLDPFLSLPN